MTGAAPEQVAAPPSGALDRLVELFRLQDLGGDEFAPPFLPESMSSFVFGGQLAGQAVAAAAATVGDQQVLHSLHCAFLGAGDPQRPIRFTVTRLRDGRSFTTRRIDASHDGVVFFTATASFQTPRADNAAAEYQVPLPAATHPDDPDAEWTPMFSGIPYFSGLDLRESAPAEPGPDGLRPYSRRVWFRPAGTVDDNPHLHASLLAFVSDFGVTVASSVTGGLYPHARVLTSLDHALWVHRPLRLNTWHLLDLVSLSNSQSRGLVRGTVHSIDGVLVASLAQETLVR